MRFFLLLLHRDSSLTEVPFAVISVEFSSRGRFRLFLLDSSLGFVATVFPSVGTFRFGRPGCLLLDRGACFFGDPLFLLP